MTLDLYVGKACYVLVGVGTTPGSTTEMFGPLEFSGRVESTRLDREELTYIQRSIARSDFAVIPQTVVDELWRHNMPAPEA